MSGGERDAGSTRGGREPPWCGGTRQPCSVAPSVHSREEAEVRNVIKANINCGNNKILQCMQAVS